MAEITLSAREPQDLQAATTIWRAASTARRLGQSPSAQRGAQVHAALQKPEAFLTLAHENGLPVGMSLATPELADDGAGPAIPGHCFFSLLFVVPERWGHGIGGQLVDAVLTEAQRRSYVRVRLWTQRDNQRAQRLYEGRGFRRTGRVMDDEAGLPIVQYEVAW
jgi:GNAT superfamily N-acetyltransferase